MTLYAGVDRVCITPPEGVELTGWGYYLERTWLDIHDELNATSLVLANDECSMAIVSLDLMVISEEFTKQVRELAAQGSDIPPENILICCQHSHNAPASGGLLGVGEVDADYEQTAAKRAAESVVNASKSRVPAVAASASTDLPGLTYNRTRSNGSIDPTLTVLRVDRTNGGPLAVVVGFQGHPTVSTVLRPRSVSRDVPGEVCDHMESKIPGCTTMYLQGACGDVNFLREFSTPERCHEPAKVIADEAHRILSEAKPLDVSQIATHSVRARMPTRRWTLEEIDADRTEANHRLQNQDLSGWRDSIGRVMTNRPDDMVARHGGDEWKAVAAMCHFNQEWTQRMLVDRDHRPEWLETEVQALRIGEFGVVSNSSEFFSTLAMQVRERSPFSHLMLACYANGRIGYMPDAYDVQRQTYASYQSPKYCNQFPFTEQSGLAMIDAMVNQLETVADANA